MWYIEGRILGPKKAATLHRLPSTQCESSVRCVYISLQQFLTLPPRLEQIRVLLELRAELYEPGLV